MTWTYIKHTLLGVLIALSLLLSVGLWSAGRRLAEPQSTSGNSTPSSLVERTKSEVFSPYEVALHGIGETGGVQLTPSNHVQDLIDETLEELEFEEVTDITTRSIEDYEEYLSWGNWIEFIYPGDLPLGIWEDTFQTLPNDYAEQTYNRLAINLNDPEQAEFYHSETETVYHVEVSHLVPEQLNAFLDTDEINYVPAESIEIGTGFIYLPSETMEIEHKYYTVGRLPTSLYVNQFFTDTAEVDSRTTGNVTRLIDMTTEVRINLVEHNLTYESQQTATDELTLTERLDRSFTELQRVENWTEDVKFGSYHPSTNQVTFQRYIEGLPVFSSQQNESIVRIGVNNNGLSELSLPLRVVQTPLDTGENYEEMPTGAEVMEQIDAAPNMERSDIEDIRIGLTWEESVEDSRVVHFVPDWYVRVNGLWHELEDFIELREG